MKFGVPSRRREETRVPKRAPRIDQQLFPNSFALLDFTVCLLLGHTLIIGDHKFQVLLAGELN
jgi:hypothetical protein